MILEVMCLFRFIVFGALMSLLVEGLAEGGTRPNLYLG